MERRRDPLQSYSGVDFGATRCGQPRASAGGGITLKVVIAQMTKLKKPTGTRLSGPSAERPWLPSGSG